MIWIRDLFRLLSGNAVAILAAFVTSVLLARELGPTDRGILAALQLVPILVVVIADSGLRQVVMRRHAAALNEGGEYGWATAVSMLSCILAAIASVIVAFSLLRGHVSIGQMLGVAVLAGANLSLIVTKGIFLAEGKTYRFALAHGTPHLLGLVLIWLAADVLDLSPVRALGILAVSAVVPAVAFGAIWMRLRAAMTCQLQIGSLYLEAWRFALPMFVAMGNYRFGLIVLTAIGLSTDAGQFVVATSLAEFLWQVPAATGLVVFSSRLRGVGGSAREVLLRAWAILGVVLFLGGLVFVFAETIVEVIFGADYFPAVAALRLLLPGVAIFSLFKVLHAFVAACGNPLFALPVLLWMLAINVVIGVPATLEWGVAGTTSVVSISYALGGISYLWIFVRTFVDVSKRGPPGPGERAS